MFSSVKSRNGVEPDPAYRTWGMDSQECSWYLDNLARVEKYKEKVLKYQNAGKQPPTLEDFFGARDCSMINR